MIISLKKNELGIDDFGREFGGDHSAPIPFGADPAHRKWAHITGLWGGFTDENDAVHRKTIKNLIHSDLPSPWRSHIWTSRIADQFSALSTSAATCTSRTPGDQRVC